MTITTAHVTCFWDRCTAQISSQGYQLQASLEGRDITNAPWQCEYEAGHVGPHSWAWEAITQSIETDDE